MFLDASLTNARAKVKRKTVVGKRWQGSVEWPQLARKWRFHSAVGRSITPTKSGQDAGPGRVEVSLTAKRVTTIVILLDGQERKGAVRGLPALLVLWGEVLCKHGLH